jgi:hypothetical protein
MKSKIIDRDTIVLPPSSIGEDGMVYCWSVDFKKWHKLAPVDAREHIVVGSSTLEGPDSEGAGGGSTTPPDASQREAEFGRMPKSTLRGLCADSKVDFTGSDTKVSLVKRLVDAGVIPR